MPSAPLQIRLDNSQELSALFAQAKATEGDLQIELRRGVKAAAQPVADSVKAAASFSTRIPGSIKVKASFAKKGASVTIVADHRKAPEAAALNNGDHGGMFRHPVYGNTDNWVAQPAHPFFVTGARQAFPAADQAMAAVMTRIAKQLGFH